jgi:hypothetical protein
MRFAYCVLRTLIANIRLCEPCRHITNAGETNAIGGAGRAPRFPYFCGLSCSMMRACGMRGSRWQRDAAFQFS